MKDQYYPNINICIKNIWTIGQNPCKLGEEGKTIQMKIFSTFGLFSFHKYPRNSKRDQDICKSNFPVL